MIGSAVLGDVFVALVIGLQTAASIAYVIQGDWKQFVVWAGVAASNTAYLLLQRS